MDSIDPPAKIPPLIPGETVITQKAEEKEPQGERSGYQRKKKTGAASEQQPEEEEESKDKNRIDILV